MILFTALGFAGLHYLGARWLFPAGVLVGMIVAHFVPKKACAIKGPSKDAA